MADTEYNAEEAAELKKRRAFRKFSYRGIDLDQYVASQYRYYPSAQSNISYTDFSTFLPMNSSTSSTPERDVDSIVV